jgi:hypothetical protein
MDRKIHSFTNLTVDPQPRPAADEQLAAAGLTETSNWKGTDNTMAMW